MLLIIAWGLGFGTLAAATSRQRARNPVSWFAFGAVLGPIATLILRSAPPGHCPACLEPTRGWLFVCGRCRTDLRPAASSRRPSDEPSDRRETVPEAAPAAPTPPVPDSQPPVAGASTETSGGGAAAAGRPEAASPLEQLDATILVGSGVYVGGTAPLVLGSRYGLVIRSESFDVVGPIDSAPERVVMSRRLDAIDATVMGGRLLVSGTGGNRARFALAFERLSGAEDDRLEAALTRRLGASADAGDGP